MNYVPYDTSVWSDFTSYIRGNIGTAVNIGIIIFAVILAIYIVVKIVKKFTK